MQQDTEVFVGKFYAKAKMISELLMNGKNRGLIDFGKL